LPEGKGVENQYNEEFFYSSIRVIRHGLHKAEAVRKRVVRFESYLGRQLLMFQISAIWLIPLRGLKRFFLEPPSGSVTPPRTRTPSES
jgi:hypothetical protein